MSDVKISASIGCFAFTPELNNGTPNWKYRASGGAVGSITVDTTVAEQHNLAIDLAPDDFFNKAKIYFPLNTPTVALRGEKAEISDFAVAASVATFTLLADLPAAPADGDLFYVFYPLNASNISITADTENIPRADNLRKNLDPQPSLKGLKIASGSFDFELIGLETPLGDGATPDLDFMGRFLEGFGTRRALAGTLVEATWADGSGGTLDLGSGYLIGDYIMINGETRRITSIASVTEDTITVEPDFDTIPEITDEVNFVESWEVDNKGHRAYTLLYQNDTRFEEYIGCVLNYAGSGAFGELFSGNAAFDASDWNWYDDFDFETDLPTKTPPEFRNTSGFFFGTTDLCVNAFEFDGGFERSRLRDTCAGQQWGNTGRAASAGATFRDVTKDVKEVWENQGTEAYILGTVGNAPGEMVGISGWAQIQDPSSAQNVEEFRYYQATFGFVDGGQGDVAKPRILRA